ncbi:hypothetical protein Tco_0680000 [Tanacetum coccineum]|uniref:Uncharacterized protein n=1 Tax=Tanacetum coccineum TaxID=301880 RepID=A0ABQ4XK91_9ASTR
MLRKCHGHGLTKGAIIQVFYHGLDESTQAILDVTAGGIFLYKTPNQAFQFLNDKVLFNHDWPIKSKNEHHQKSVSFADGSNNGDNSRLMEKLEALTVKMDSQIISLNEELKDIRNKYNELKEGNASKNQANDDTKMCERHETNYIKSEDYQNQNSHDSSSRQSVHDPNDSEKSLTELNNDVRKDLKDFKRCVRSMRTVHWKLYDSDDRKTTGVLPNKKSKPINQEPQSKTDFEKLMTKFLDGQRVTNMFFKNNVNDMILKMKQNEKNFQTKIKNMERKIDEWSKSQNVSSKQTDRTDPPPPQAHTEHVNAVFTGSGKSDYSPKNLKDPPPSIIVNNKIKKDRPIKTSKKGYHVVKTKEYPYRIGYSTNRQKTQQKGQNRLGMLKEQKKSMFTDVKSTIQPKVTPSKVADAYISLPLLPISLLLSLFLVEMILRLSALHFLTDSCEFGGWVIRTDWKLIKFPTKAFDFVCVVEENERIHEDKKLKRRSKLKIKIPRHIPSHEGYQNTIEHPDGVNVVPLRPDTIRLVQNGCSLHELRSEDPNQHLKDFLKLTDSLDLDVANKERTRLYLFQFSLHDQASESLSEAWTRFKYLLQKAPHHGIDLWLQVQIFYDHVNPATRRTIDQSAGGKLRDKNAKESWAHWALLE